jgi:hypothetical protein
VPVGKSKLGDVRAAQGLGVAWNFRRNDMRKV